MAKEAKEKKEKINKEECEKTAASEKEEQKTEETCEWEKKYKDVNDKYMRTLAEYDNYRKRTVKEKESIYPEAKATVAEKFLAVADNLDRALGAAVEKDSFYEGVEMVKKQLDEVFKALGVEEIRSVGESFDPAFHNAVMHIEDENAGENIIVEEFQKGYRIGDRVIRHSMVKVAN